MYNICRILHRAKSEGKKTDTGQKTDMKLPTIQVDEAMRDFSIHVKLINATGEYLKDVEAKATYGEWRGVPSVIPPNSNASFELNDTVWFSSSGGTFKSTACDTAEKVRAKLSTCQEDPYISDNNISLTTPDPQALYAFSFRAKVDGGNWTDNYVEKRGHPVYVEYTLEYQRKRFRFSLISITATSAHAIRNSHKELIVGKHTLWSSLNPSIYPDGTHGSFQPNVFAYQFNSPVPEVGILDVTVKPLDIQLVGAEVLLFGIVDGKRVFQSDHFFFKSMAEVTVQAHVIIPIPFSWNADVDWGMELKLSNQGLDRFGPGITRLELYWIATTVHCAFKQSLPINFLRQVLKAHDVSPVMVYSDFYADMTRRVSTDCLLRSNSIDTDTNLYQVHGTSPGTVANVASGSGITGIDGQPALTDVARVKSTMLTLPEPLSQLLVATLANIMEAVTHIDWAHVPRWLKAVLGDAWDIPFGQVTVGGTTAHAFWYLADADAPDSPIRVHVQVVSVIGQDGSLDIDQSADNAGKCVRDILMSTTHDVWMMRTLPGLEESSLQYADTVNAGRIVVIAGNVVMDIAGMSSSAALLPHALKLLKLLNYTARRQSNTTPALHFVVPRLRRRLVRTMIGTGSATTQCTLRGNEAESDIITIHGTDSRFSVVFTSDRMIVTASAVCDGSGVLFDRQIIEEMEDKDGHAVSFLFVVREVGHYVVHVYVVDSETMVTATQEMHIEVVNA